jgi:repressor LexA
MRQLNQNALDILAFLRAKAAATNLPPSRAEICAATGIKSTGTVQRLLQRLDAAGYIELQPGTARAIRVIDLSDGQQSA